MGHHRMPLYVMTLELDNNEAINVKGKIHQDRLQPLRDLSEKRRNTSIDMSTANTLMTFQLDTIHRYEPPMIFQPNTSQPDDEEALHDF